MASSSASVSDAATGRLREVASMLFSDNQSLIADIRSAVTRMRAIAVDFEKDNQTEMVKDLDNSVAELLSTCDNCTHYSSASQAVANSYQPKSELTNFKKLLEDQFVKLKATTPSTQNHPLMRQFREAIWNVHHAGQPMPGDEQEDIIMSSTQTNILNITCPLSGKPVVELTNPVRSMECRHIYEKMAIENYISSELHARCPVAGCPRILKIEKVICDAMLKIDIDEMRSMTKESARTEVIEDYTELDDVQ